MHWNWASKEHNFPLAPPQENCPRSGGNEGAVCLTKAPVTIGRTRTVRKRFQLRDTLAFTCLLLGVTSDGGKRRRRSEAPSVAYCITTVNCDKLRNNLPLRYLLFWLGGRDSLEPKANRDDGSAFKLDMKTILRRCLNKTDFI